MKIMQSMNFLPRSFILNVAKEVKFEDVNLEKFADKFQDTIKKGIYKLPCSKREVMMVVNLDQSNCTGMLMGFQEAIQNFKGINNTLDRFIGDVNSKFEHDPKFLVRIGQQIVKERGC